jgi:hypothetical protein
MIKLFRNIRQNLLAEGKKTSRYLKYAIGEIILVVIGILIALSINNWNENRKEHLLEKRYLSDLRTDLQKDSLAINDMLKQSAGQMRSKSLLFRFLDEHTKYTLNDYNAGKDSFYKYEYKSQQVADSIQYHFFSQWQVLYNFTPNITTIEEMKSTGNIGVISDKNLRRLVLETYNAYELYKLNSEGLFKQLQEELFKLIFSKIPLIYHMNNDDLIKVFDNPEMVNRFEGNYVTGINADLHKLNEVNDKLLSRLNTILKKEHD